MRKGISPVIASILLVLIAISLGSAFLVFSGRLTQDTTATVEEEAAESVRLATTTFSIESIKDQRVFIRNTGGQAIGLKSLDVRIDEKRINYTQESTIEQGSSGSIRITDLWEFGPGEHSLKISGAAASAHKSIRVKPNDGVVLDMRFEEGSGNIANDVSGNNNGGVLTGVNSNEVWVEGKVGEGLKLDGSDDFVEISDTASLDMTSAISVEAWVRASSVIEDDTFVSKIPDSGTSALWYLTRRLGTNNWEFTIRYGPGADDRARAIGTTAVQGGVWYHLLGTYNGGTVRIYVDGVEDGSVPHTQNIQISDGAVNVGRGYWNVPGNFVDGNVDEVRIYNQAYAPDELYVMEES